MFDFIPLDGGELIHREWNDPQAKYPVDSDKYPEDKTEKGIEYHVAPAIREHMKDQWCITMEIYPEILAQIHTHGESAYPEEGAGLLLGTLEGERKCVSAIRKLANAREDSARHNRYLLPLRIT